MSDLADLHQPIPDDDRAPYLEALVALRDADPGRFMVPGHHGGRFSDPALVEAVGERALALDIPSLIGGIDAGPPPHPFQQAQVLAARAWGARRSWFLANGASNGNHVALVALAQTGKRRIVMQRNIHGSCIDGLVISGLEPVFVQPEVDPELGIAHCVSPAALAEALDAAGPDVAGALVVTPTYFGFAADVAALAEVAHARGVPLLVDEAWGSHFAFHPDLPQHAIAAGADLANSSTHKMLGSLTQSAMLHLGGSLLDEEVLHRSVLLAETTSPNALLGASLDATRRRAVVHGERLIGEGLAEIERLHAELRAIDGVDVLDRRQIGRFGIAGWDPFRVAIDVRGTGLRGTELQHLLRETDEVLVELANEHVVVVIWSLGGAGLERERLVAGLRRAIALGRSRPTRAATGAAPLVAPPPGRLALRPRDAYFARHRRVALRDAIGAVAAEALAVYPPGIPNVLPGEEVTEAVVAYLEQAVAAGQMVRGASDPEVSTLLTVDAP